MQEAALRKQMASLDIFKLDVIAREMKRCVCVDMRRVLENVSSNVCVGMFIDVHIDICKVSLQA